jgi:uncharacterized membrane-anchored protein YitT (DUF2179 family)
VKDAKLKTLRNIFYLILGAVLGAFAINVIYTPLYLTMGGISGIASIIYQMTGQGDFLPFGALVMLLNLPLLALGWWQVGRRFVFKSIVGTVIYSLAIDLFKPLMRDWFKNYFDLPHMRGYADPIIFCLFGGIIYGIAIGLIVRGGFTTGGTDILGIIIYRRVKRLSIGKVLLIIDLLIVLSTFFFYQDRTVVLILYSLFAMYLTSYFMDIAIDGLSNKRTVYVITSAYQEVARYVLDTLDRGATFLHGEGAYSGESRPVLMVVMAHRQVPPFKDFVASVDPKAFMVVSDSREVLGEGFERDIAEFL